MSGVAAVPFLCRFHSLVNVCLTFCRKSASDVFFVVFLRVFSVRDADEVGDVVVFWVSVLVVDFVPFGDWPVVELPDVAVHPVTSAREITLSRIEFVSLSVKFLET